MRKLTVFNQISLDGYFTDEKGDVRWAHKNDDDAEWQAFTNENAGSGGELLFGRVTYEMMESFWPTPAAAKQFPKVAEGMNKSSKVVFSKTLDKVTWENTKLVKDHLVEEVQKMKEASGPTMVIMGSGTIISQLANANLIDEYNIVVNPIVLGSGRTMFDDVKKRFDLQLKKSRSFKNGNVVFWYERAK